MRGPKLCPLRALPCRLLESAAGLNEEQLEAGGATLETGIRHKYGEPVGVRVKITMGGGRPASCWVALPGGQAAEGLPGPTHTMRAARTAWSLEPAYMAAAAAAP